MDSTAQPLVAKVRSDTNGIYVIDTFVSVLTKTTQAPDSLQSTATTASPSIATTAGRSAMSVHWCGRGGRNSASHRDADVTRRRSAMLPLIVRRRGHDAGTAAHASDIVTYEVVSDTIPQANVEYVDASGRKLLESVHCHWATRRDPRRRPRPTGPGAQLRADWRPLKSKGEW